jgi:putative methyltransferase
MNIYLTQVSDVYGPNKFLPLAIGYQWCYGKNDNWTLKDVSIEKIPPKDYVKTLDNPSMIAMSSYIWNWEYNKKLATEVKKSFPNCVIVTGGPQIHKRDPEFFDKNPMFDAVIHGEGERSFKEILARPLGEYDNIDHVQTKTHMPKPAQRVKDISDIPSPILEGFYEPIMAKYSADTLWQVTWESLRGCPYHCAFCDIGDSYWNKLTLFDMNRCKKEIDWMGRNRIEYVSVCDSNWGLLDRDIELTKFVLETKEKYGYPMWWDATWAKNNVDRNFDIAMLNKRSPVNIFKGVTFAMQSFNESTLTASERFNINEKQVAEYLVKYREENIPTYSELIWPMPEETYDSLKDNVQKLIDLGQDSYLMIHPLVITYNATMGDTKYKEKYQIVTKDVPLDTYYLSADDLENYIVERTDAVYSTRTATWEDNLRGHMFSWVSILMYYYGWGHYLAKYLKTKSIKETVFFEKMLTWIESNPGTLLNHEYNETKQHIYDTFHNGLLWGRKVRGETDIYWEYKGASSNVLHDNITKLENELVMFLSDTKLIPEEKIKDVVKLNLHMCRLKDLKYPFKTTAPRDIIQDMLGINSDTIIIDHSDKTTPHATLWYNKAYHWDRKSKYWCCSVSNGKTTR